MPVAKSRVKVAVAFSPEEHRQVRRLARRAGLSINRWVAAVVRARVCAKPTLGAPRDVTLVEALTELRRIGVALRHLAQQQPQDQTQLQSQVGAYVLEVLEAIRGLREVLNGNLHELRHGVG